MCFHRSTALSFIILFLEEEMAMVSYSCCACSTDPWASLSAYFCSCVDCRDQIMTSVLELERDMTNRSDYDYAQPNRYKHYVFNNHILSLRATPKWALKICTRLFSYCVTIHYAAQSRSNLLADNLKNYIR